MFGTPLSGVTEEDIPEAKEIVAIAEPKIIEEKTIKPVAKLAVAKPVEIEIPEVKGEATTTVPVTFKNVNLDLKKEETYKPEANITDKAIFYGPKYINTAFMLLFSVIFVATLLMVFIEIKRQHPKHIAYAVLLLVILLILMYFNVNYFELSFRAI
jgi:hypothetical protein